MQPGLFRNLQACVAHDATPSGCNENSVAIPLQTGIFRPLSNELKRETSAHAKASAYFA
jgi:hypothetical protein